jgi:hypothetical protein
VLARLSRLTLSTNRSGHDKLNSLANLMLIYNTKICLEGCVNIIE